jgi:hypothetical protein
MIRFGLCNSLTSPPAGADIVRAMAEGERRALDADARVKRAYLR